MSSMSREYYEHLIDHDYEVTHVELIDSAYEAAHFGLLAYFSSSSLSSLECTEILKESSEEEEESEIAASYVETELCEGIQLSTLEVTKERAICSAQAMSLYEDDGQSDEVCSICHAFDIGQEKGQNVVVITMPDINIHEYRKGTTRNPASHSGKNKPGSHHQNFIIITTYIYDALCTAI